MYFINTVQQSACVRYVSWYWNGGDKRTYYTIRDAHNIRAGQTATLTFRRSRSPTKKSEKKRGKNLLERFEAFCGRVYAYNYYLSHRLVQEEKNEKERESERENNESRLYGTTRRYTINNIIHHAWYFFYVFFVYYISSVYIFSHITRCVPTRGACDCSRLLYHFSLFFIIIYSFKSMVTTEKKNSTTTNKR